jgi:transmembrane sensor
MGLFQRISGWFRRRESLPGGQSPDALVFQELLDSQAEKLRAADPDTGRQWQYLNVALHQRSARAHVGKPAIVSWLWKPALSFGAVAAIALIVVGIFRLTPSSSLMYETGRGEQSSVFLADSSEVTLNHTSELIVESESFGTARNVALKGEAFFHVRRSGSPFTVRTDIGTVTVLGTQFDVRVRGDQLVVGVVSGSVRVSAVRDGHDSSVVLSAGQILTCSKGEYPSAPGVLPFAQYPGWTEGKFLFYRTELLAACKEIEAQFDVQIRIEDPLLMEETITGTVDGRNAASAVAALANLTGNKFRHENSTYTLF